MMILFDGETGMGGYMELNNFSSPSYTGNVDWDNPNPGNDVEKINFVYVNSDLKRLIKRKESRSRKKKSFADHYLYFCGTVSYLSHTDKRFKDKEYVNINYNTMTSVISEYKYSEVLMNLQDWGIISIDNSYSAGNYSKGFKINPPYNGNLKKTMIKDALINKKINSHRKKELQKLHQLPYSYQYLEMTNTWIQMDTKKANKYNKMLYLNETDISTYDSNFFSICAYNDLDYRFTVDSTGNRAHTNLTNLKSDFRKFLSVRGEKLGQVDIKNSQPAFFYLLIKDHIDIPEDEKQRYKTLVESGLFYEYFLEKLELPIEKRNVLKEKIIAAIFYDHYRTKESRYITAFKVDFPFITAYLNTRKISDHKELAAELQKMESEFIIENVVAEYIKEFEGNFISTIHDSIIVKEHDLALAENLMKKCFMEIGIQPKLSSIIF